MIRTYDELMQYETLDERYRYLKLDGQVGRHTFGDERYLNQRFYTSHEWKAIREYVIARDEACDLAMPGYDIHDRIIIHHMNPLVVQDLINGHLDILDPKYLITVTHKTHNAIHYGDEHLPLDPVVVRKPGDHILW